MKLMRLIILIFSFICIFSCTNTEVKNNNIDKFISKYQNETFSKFIGVSITFRDSDFGSDIYMVSKQGGKYPPYIIHFNKRLKQVTSIDDKLLKQSNFNSYFDENQIKDLMKEFIEFDVKNLSADSIGNIFISPFYGEYSPNLLRLNTTKIEKVVKKGYVYDWYKDNWYLNKKD